MPNCQVDFSDARRAIMANPKLDSTTADVLEVMLEATQNAIADLRAAASRAPESEPSRRVPSIAKMMEVAVAIASDFNGDERFGNWREEIYDQNFDDHFGFWGWIVDIATMAAPIIEKLDWDAMGGTLYDVVEFIVDAMYRRTVIDKEWLAENLPKANGYSIDAARNAARTSKAT